MISFQQSLDLTNLPIITIEHSLLGKINVLIDSGSDKSCINKSFISKYADIKDNLDCGTVTTGGSDTKIFGAVELECKCQGYELTDTFLVLDLDHAFNSIKMTSGVTIHGIIGTSLLTKYKYIIDFNKNCFYAK